ncbi:MAG: ribose-phosphate diphosphokinase [Patescibacteria group bacterium]
MDKFLLFSGVGGDSLASAVAKRLDMELSPVKWSRFLGVVPGGEETKPEILCNVADRHCVIVWSVGNTNDELMQIFQLARGLKRQGEASMITLVAPYFPYARQDKSHGRREPVTAELIADLLLAAGVDRMVYLDIHAEQIEGFFGKSRVRSLWMDNIYLDYLGMRLPEIMETHGISSDSVRNMPPDEGAVTHNYRLAKVLKHELAVHLKKRDWSKEHSVTSMGIAGDVVSCLVYTRDDICASGDSLFAAAAEAKAKGAKYVIALVTHTQGFNKPGEKSFVEKLRDSAIDELVTTNSLTWFTDKVLSPSARLKQNYEKITVLDISYYLAVVIRRINSGLTIREMMNEIKVEDLYREL